MPEGFIRQLGAGSKDPKTRLTLAKALLLETPSADEVREAAGLLENVVAGEPTNAAAHGLLGKTLAQLGETRRAAAELSEAIPLDPLDRASIYQLVTIYRRTGKSADAARLAGRLKSLIERERNEESAAGRFHFVRGDGFVSPRDQR